MPEPASSAAVTLAAASLAIPALSAFGIPLGLRPELLIAGFSGALAAIALLDSVPSTGDTWRELIKTTRRRIGVAGASSLTAGYLAPLLPLLVAMPDVVLFGGAFVVGAGAQQVLRALIKRYADKIVGGEQ